MRPQQPEPGATDVISRIFLVFDLWFSLPLFLVVSRAYMACVCSLDEQVSCLILTVRKRRLGRECELAAGGKWRAVSVISIPQSWGGQAGPAVSERE